MRRPLATPKADPQAVSAIENDAFPVIVLKPNTVRHPDQPQIESLPVPYTVFLNDHRAYSTGHTHEPVSLITRRASQDKSAFTDSCAYCWIENRAAVFVFSRHSQEMTAYSTGVYLDMKIKATGTPERIWRTARPVDYDRLQESIASGAQFRGVARLTTGHVISVPVHLIELWESKTFMITTNIDSFPKFIVSPSKTLNNILEIILKFEKKSDLDQKKSNVNLNTVKCYDFLSLGFKIKEDGNYFLYNASDLHWYNNENIDFSLFLI